MDRNLSFGVGKILNLPKSWDARVKSRELAHQPQVWSVVGAGSVEEHVASFPTKQVRVRGQSTLQPGKYAHWLTPQGLRPPVWLRVRRPGSSSGRDIG